MKSIVRIFLLALITVIIAGIIIKLDYTHALKTANSESSDKVILTIADGESAPDILQSLVDQGLINPKWVNYSKIYLRLNKLASKLQAGTYNIPKNLNIIEIFQTLQNGKDQEIWVTIPEGLRKDEIANTLAKNIGSTFNKDTFLALTIDQEFIKTFGLNSDVKDLEGYLFPDKYAFAQDVTEKDIATRLVETFKTKVGVNDSYQTIVLASLTEKEGRTANDRAMITGIILKRYKEGMVLGLDTTTLYYLKTWDESKITDNDLKANNPYNTRIVAGFPPTPICNPGLESINAARNPVNSTYYYFISDLTGVMHYARTYEEHIANVNKYLR
jgi:UPF0755 protein